VLNTSGIVISIVFLLRQQCQAGKSGLAFHLRT
jgi:hypothetical protein